MGVYKSVNSGVNWAPFGLPGQIVSALGLSHMTPGMIFAGTPTGLYTSTNYGGTWKPANRGLIREISCLPDPAGYPQIDLISTLGSGVYTRDQPFLLNSTILGIVVCWPSLLSLLMMETLGGLSGCMSSLRHGQSASIFPQPMRRGYFSHPLRALMGSVATTIDLG
jgi:hypothetical protein